MICALCGQKATELHHIIPRGHISGKAAENWKLNLIPLCKACHQRLHVEGGVEYKELWKAMGYSVKELLLLVLLGDHPKAVMYPLVGRRSRWAWGQLTEGQRVDLDGLRDAVRMPHEIREYAEFIGAKPMPGWV